MQSQAGSFETISPTAFMVAYARQFTDIPYSKELSQLVGTQTFMEQLQEKNLEQPAEIAVIVEANYKSVDQSIIQIAKSDACQILELASGLSPRGMVMSENPDVTFVESDLPGMINHKRQLVKHLVGDRPNLHFTTIDATSFPSQFPIDVEYLRLRKPITILCEGLLMYLTFAEKHQLFANVREILEIYGGVWITPDLTTKDGLEHLRQISPSLQRLNQTASVVSHRPINNYHFENLGHVKKFAYEQGFWIEEYNTLDVMDQLTCLEALEINHDVASSILACLSVFALTLGN